MPESMIRLAVVLLALAVVAGAWVVVDRRRRRPRAARHTLDVRAIAASVPMPASARQVVVQFSGPHCGACGPSAKIWRSVVAEPDVFVTVDVEENLALSQAFGVLSVPTSLVFDSTGELRTRLTGAPSPAHARAALAGSLQR